MIIEIMGINQDYDYILHRNFSIDKWNVMRNNQTPKLYKMCILILRVNSTNIIITYFLHQYNLIKNYQSREF